jgi:hypothetical protein
VLSIAYRGGCAGNQAIFERWFRIAYVNGAVSATFTASGSAFVGVAGRAGNNALYSLTSLITGSRVALICLVKSVGSQLKPVRCATPTPGDPAAPKTLTLVAQGKVLTALFNTDTLFSYTDSNPQMGAGQWAFFTEGAGSDAADPQGRVTFTRVTLYQK